MTNNVYLEAADPSNNIWVSASAGSGKTTILVNRFLRLLLSGADPKKILCITFTTNAATEMINRIFQELSIWAIEDKIKLQHRLKILMQETPGEKIIAFARQLFLKCLDEKQNLQIQTIHSFCQSIISKFPFEAGILPDAQLIEDYQQSSLIHDAKNILLENYSKVSNNPETLDYLLENIHEYSLKNLIDHGVFLHSVTDDIISTAEKKNQYLENIAKNLSPAKNCKLIISDIIKKIDEHEKYLKQIENIEIITTLFELRYKINVGKGAEDTVEQLENIFLTQKGVKRTKLIKAEVAKRYPELLDILGKIQDLVFDYKEAVGAENILKFTSGFINLAYEFNQQFSQHKNNQNYIDYNDLISKCLTLISDPQLSLWIKYKLSKQIDHILVDESQDTSLKQWQIIYALIEEILIASDKQKTIFIVGDPKQAIYSFQGSSPEIFHAVHKHLHNIARNNGKIIKDISLSRSFRSDNTILKLVDTTFCNLIKNTPEYFLENSISHVSDINSQEAAIELWPLIVKEKSEDDISPWQVKMDYDTQQIPPKILAKKIADYVLHLIDSGRAQAADIMILVRKRDELVEFIVNELKRQQIPVNGSDRLNLTKNLAIQDLLAVAKFILLPVDDYNLACLLKSPICNFFEEELFVVTQRGELSLWDNLEKHSNYNDKFYQSYTLLKEILDNKNLYTPYKLFSYLLDTRNIRTKFLSRFGMQLAEILDEFINIIIKFEQNSNSLSEFVYFFENSNIEFKVNLDLSKDEVKIMTIHGAKGLESKIVILPDTTSIPKNKNTVLLDHTSNLALYNGGSDNNTELYQKLLENMRIKTMQEYYRLLYVALTRASHKLVICGWSNSEKISDDSWYSLLKESVTSMQNIEQLQEQ